jgi:sugar lactone lactonase YvrE
MSPDEKWLYVLDSINGHVFDIGGGVNVQPLEKYNVRLNRSLPNHDPQLPDSR